MIEISSSTWLFVPGDRPDRFSKAAESGADEVIIDLEDAVADNHKALARADAAKWLSNRGQAWVRINAVNTPWADADIETIATCPGLRGVLVPKAERAANLSMIGGRLGSDRGVIALVETALGIHNAHELAACPEVGRLAFGSVDFAHDIDATEDDRSLLLARSTLVLASKVADLPAPIDGVSVRIRDSEAVAEAAEQARALGFGGKLCIHPAQIAATAAAFRPSREDIAWAQRIVASFTGQAGAVRADGEMVDKPVFERARRILARSSIAYPKTVD
ncbi:HpcH/HpaI aldolase/citrate lyase family protein [Nocardia sp. NPDC049526]|uniref:HpcH/HpaI aldolase/citrate lyase family protein n=1 Tax=Nocardia sp. NPDC049526 TaxID=3364316 RepID=UPI00378762E1